MTAAQRDSLRGQSVHLFSEISEENSFASTITPSKARISNENSLRSRLHAHSLPCSEESDKAAIGALQIQGQF